MMVGRTVAALQRNVLNDLQDILGAKHFYWVNRQQGEVYMLGRRVHIVGANSEDAEAKIRGVTLAGALCDEANLYPESFFAQLMARLSIEGAQCFCNCNPDSPFHWFYTNYIMNDTIEDKQIWHFTLEDNPNLSESYVKSLKQMYTGIFYRRFILGEWCVAEGAIYDMFDADVHIKTPPEIPPYGKLIVGCDYGTSTVMAWSLMYKASDGTYYKIKEYYYDARESKVQKTDSEFYDDFIEWLGPYVYRIDVIYCDPSASSWITLLSRNGSFNVQKANNDVINGIRAVGSLLTENKFFIDPGCVATIREYPNYMWDPKQQAKGIDRPIKLNDHTVDSDRYVIYSDRVAGGGGVFDVR